MFVALIAWNVVLATLLAMLVTLASRMRYFRERPALRHCLWLLVLFKLVTPPLIPLPLLMAEPESALADFVSDAMESAATLEEPQGDGSRSRGFRVNAPSVETVVDWLTILCLTSLVVTVALAVRLFVQLLWLSRLLHRADWSDSRVNALARQEAARMGICQTPDVCVVNAVITPLLWTSKGRPIVVLPQALLQELSDEQTACVVAHELAHFVRCDHWSNAMACFVGCLFWFNPVVWWARRELKAAQEACCDAMVIRGNSSIRRTYAETLLQVIEFVDDRGVAPHLTSGFGESLSLTRRFEMIANERVTHRMSRMTGLAVTVLFGLACCYPAMAQTSNRTGPAANSASDQSPTVDFQLQFKWTTKPDATLTFKYDDEATGKGELVIRAERYPESSLTEMMRAMRDVEIIKVAKLTTEYPKQENGFVTVTIRSNPFSSTRIPLALADVSKHFAVKRMSIHPSTTVEPTLNRDTRSDAKRFDADLQKWFHEMQDAVRSASPAPAEDTGWRIELQGRHYYPAKDPS